MMGRSAVSGFVLGGFPAQHPESCFRLALVQGICYACERLTVAYL